MNMSKYKNQIILFSIIALGSLLRIVNISKRDFWYDEAFTGITIRDNFSGMMKIITNDVHPPLYYILVKYFSALWNYNAFGIRLFSAIFGVLCLVAIYFFALELFDKKTALWTSFLSAIGPFAIQYSQEARMYTMYCFFIILSSYFFLRALKTKEYKFYLLWGFFLGVSALTHFMSFVFIIVFYLVFLAWNFNFPKSKKLKNKILHYFKLLLPGVKLISGYFLALLTFSPWILNFLKSLSAADLDWIKPVAFSDVFYNIQMFIFGIPPGEMSAGMPSPNVLKNTYPSTVLVLVAIFFTSLLIYLLFFKKEIRKTLIVSSLSLGFMLIVYFVSLAGSQYFVPRYLMPANYFIFILVARWLSGIRFRYSFSIILFYLFLLYFAMVPVQASEGWHAMTNNLQKYNGKNFYSLNSFDYVIAKYYLGGERLTLYNIDWPQYNPYFWAAIGSDLKRTENYDDIKNDPNALIIYNVQAKREYRSDKTFDFKKDSLNLVDRYKNVLIYKF